ncbi:hypothetical protein ACFE04_005459 [Oxalis oulophora]
MLTGSPKPDPTTKTHNNIPPIKSIIPKKKYTIKPSPQLDAIHTTPPPLSSTLNSKALLFLLSDTVSILPPSSTDVVAVAAAVSVLELSLLDDEALTFSDLSDSVALNHGTTTNEEEDNRYDFDLFVIGVGSLASEMN